MANRRKKRRFMKAMKYAWKKQDECSELIHEYNELIKVLEFELNSIKLKAMFFGMSIGILIGGIVGAMVQ